MKRKYLWMAVCLIILAAGTSSLIAYRKNKDASKVRPASQTSHNPNNAGSSPSTQSRQTSTLPKRKEDTWQYGTYLEYSTADFSQAKEKQRLLFFYAQWDDTSRKLDENIRKNKIPKDMVIFQVEYDASSAMRREYSVDIPGTVIEVDSTNKSLKRATPQPTLEVVLRELK